MATPLPVVVEALLQVDAAREPAAWAAFAEEYSPLVLHVARTLGGNRDAVMDRYAYVLERLRADGARRLRGYASDGRGKFTTWLVVVVRRLCLDQQRQRYGRAQGAGCGEERARRRALADLAGVPLDGAEEIAAEGVTPDASVMESETRGALAAALERLDPGDRLLLHLRFDDELSVPEIARLTGEASAFALYRRIERVLARLRQELQRMGIEARSA